MNGLVITLKVLVAIVVLASTPLALKRRWRLFLAIPLAVLQVFVPGVEVAGVPIPLAFWGGLMLWPELVREFRVVATWKPTVYLLTIVALYIVSLLWSPNPKMGLQPIGYFLQFLVIFAAVVSEGRRDYRLILKLLMVTTALTGIEALLVVIGRIAPGIKLAFFLSPIAKWLITPNIISKLFSDTYNGLFDSTKSGGMFVNANVAATFLGVIACMSFGLALHFRKKWLGLASIMLLASVPFTGSKAGLMLAVAVPILMLHLMTLHYRAWRNRLRMIMAALLVAGTVGWFGPKAIRATQSDVYTQVGVFFQHSNKTLSVREKIWAYGAEAFMQHPFEGQGFGGWQQNFPKYARKVGIQSDVPPEDTIIYLWSRGGLLTALMGLLFMYEVLRISWHQIRDPDALAFGLSLAMLSAYLWTFVRGMGSNFGLLGDVHMSPILATLLALGYLQRRVDGKQATSNAFARPQQSAPDSSPGYPDSAPEPSC